MSKTLFLFNVLFFTILILSKISANPVENTENTENTDDGILKPEDRKKVDTCLDTLRKNEVDGVLVEMDEKKMARSEGCTLYCILKRLDFLDENNKIDTDKFTEYASSLKKTRFLGNHEEDANMTNSFVKCAKETNSKTFEDNCDMLGDTVICMDKDKKTEWMEKTTE